MGCAITNSTSRFISLQSNACGIDYRNGLQPFAAELPCHLHCTVLLYVAMPLQFYCHTQTSSTFLSVIHLSNSSMTAALMPLVLYTSANRNSRVYLTHLPTGVFCFRFLFHHRRMEPNENLREIHVLERNCMLYDFSNMIV